MAQLHGGEHSWLFVENVWSVYSLTSERPDTMTIRERCRLCRVQGSCRSFAFLSGLSSLSGHFSASWLTTHPKNKNAKKAEKSRSWRRRLAGQ